MKKTILTCDRCKKVVEELIEVGAGERDYNPSSYGGGGSYRVYQLYAEWCLDCCIETGITQENKKSWVKPIDPPPTLENIIREIVREETENK